MWYAWYKCSEELPHCGTWNIHVVWTDSVRRIKNSDCLQSLPHTFSEQLLESNTAFHVKSACLCRTYRGSHRATQTKAVRIHFHWLYSAAERTACIWRTLFFVTWVTNFLTSWNKLTLSFDTFRVEQFVLFVSFCLLFLVYSRGTYVYYSFDKQIFCEDWYKMC